jgi:hypothetical protein
LTYVLGFKEKEKAVQKETGNRTRGEGSSNRPGINGMTTFGMC